MLVSRGAVGFVGVDASSGHPGKAKAPIVETTSAGAEILPSGLRILFHERNGRGSLLAMSPMRLPQNGKNQQESVLRNLVWRYVIGVYPPPSGGSFCHRCEISGGLTRPSERVPPIVVTK